MLVFISFGRQILALYLKVGHSRFLQHHFEFIFQVILLFDATELMRLRKRY
jgi:hypothetical protein